MSIPEVNLSEQSVKEFITSFDDWLSPSTIAVTRPIDCPFTSVEVQEFIYIHCYQLNIQPISRKEITHNSTQSSKEVQS